MKITWIFRQAKLHQKKYVETTWIFLPVKLHRKSPWKQRGLLNTEITSKKIRGNNKDFSTIEVTSKKVHGNNVDFSISEITSKKCVEITWSLTYQRNIDVESTSIWRGVAIGEQCYCVNHFILESESSYRNFHILFIYYVLYFLLCTSTLYIQGFLFFFIDTFESRYCPIKQFILVS